MGKTIYILAIGILIGLLAAGLIFLISSPSHSAPILILPTPTSPLIAVHLSGQVHSPGVYYLAPGSRVQDALLIAGGFTEQADADQINLAARLSDGQKLYIPAKGEVLNVNNPIQTPLPTNSSRELPAVIDLNLASQQELESLPGIGPTKASEIIAYRQKNGRFVTIEEIQNVPGIGAALFNKIQPYITVTNSP